MTVHNLKILIVELFCFQMVKLTADEVPAAKKAMFSRHPEMVEWPESHRELN